MSNEKIIAAIDRNTEAIDRARKDIVMMPGVWLELLCLATITDEKVLKEIARKAPED